MLLSERLDDIKILLSEANEISERISNSNLVACADEDRISDILSEMFRECHIDWLIEQAEKVEEYEKVLKQVMLMELDDTYHMVMLARKTLGY